MWRFGQILEVQTPNVTPQCVFDVLFETHQRFPTELTILKTILYVYTMSLSRSTGLEAPRERDSVTSDMNSDSESRWHDIRVLLQTVERDSCSLETLGLQEVDDLLDNLDHISDLLHSFECIVKSRRNTMSAISRLSNETLCTIFSTLDICDLLSGAHHRYLQRTLNSFDATVLFSYCRLYSLARCGSPGR